MSRRGVVGITLPDYAPYHPYLSRFRRANGEHGDGSRERSSCGLPMYTESVECTEIDTWTPENCSARDWEWIRARLELLHLVRERPSR